MNHRITPSSTLSALIPSLASIVTSRGGLPTDHYELEDTVLRAGSYAWDIGGEASPLHNEISSILAAKAAADAALAAAPPTIESLKSQIAQRRWEEESKGTTVDFGDGRVLSVMTDSTSQSKLTGLLVVASSQPIAVKWKGSNGMFLAISNPDVLKMATAVFTHVQTCFGRESQLLDLLDAVPEDGRVAFQSVINQFWP